MDSQSFKLLITRFYTPPIHHYILYVPLEVDIIYIIRTHKPLIEPKIKMKLYIKNRKIKKSDVGHFDTPLHLVVFKVINNPMLITFYPLRKPAWLYFVLDHDLVLVNRSFKKVLF